MALERCTTPKRSRRTCSPRCTVYDPGEGNRRAWRSGGVSSPPTRIPSRPISQLPTPLRALYLRHQPSPRPTHSSLSRGAVACPQLRHLLRHQLHRGGPGRRPHEPHQGAGLAGAGHVLDRVRAARRVHRVGQRRGQASPRQPALAGAKRRACVRLGGNNQRECVKAMGKACPATLSAAFSEGILKTSSLRDRRSPVP
jgi:hypothetical protein